MRDATLSREEGLALGIAVAAHVALVAALSLAPPGKERQPPPERMTITFSEEVADQSTSPEPDAQSMPDVAPQLGEPQPEAAPDPAPAEQPQPAPPQPAPPEPAPPKPVPPKPVPPQPKPAPRPMPKPAPAKPAPAPNKVAQPAKPAPARPAPAQPKAAPARQAAPARPAANAATAPRRPTTAPAGGSRIGSDFLAGVQGSQAPGTSRNPPAATIGADVRASLASAIARAIKPRWTAPQGVDAEKLVTVLAWEMNPDGSLAGRPRVVQQSGITDANRPQAQRHAEQAIRAVQLAAPFDLPQEHYNGWKRVGAFRFDRKLSQ